MEDIFIECSPGISGDMLLGALYDLGVPKNVIEKPLIDLGLTGLYKIEFKESKSCSIRGIKAKVENIDCGPTKRDWRSIKELILHGKIEEKLQKIIYEVFESLAIAEGKVHGINPEDVHFHEIGAFRRPRNPNPVPGGIQNQSKNMIKIIMETDAEQILQKLSNSIRKCLQNRSRKLGRNASRGVQVTPRWCPNCPLDPRNGLPDEPRALQTAFQTVQEPVLEVPGASRL